jgi:hypothetical protein
MKEQAIPKPTCSMSSRPDSSSQKANKMMKVSQNRDEFFSLVIINKQNCLDYSPIQRSLQGGVLVDPKIAIKVPSLAIKACPFVLNLRE